MENCVERNGFAVATNRMRISTRLTCLFLAVLIFATAALAVPISGMDESAYTSDGSYETEENVYDIPYPDTPDNEANGSNTDTIVAAAGEIITIGSWSDLYAFLSGEGPSNGSYILTQSIIADGSATSGRGLGQDGHIFTGIFDGSGHTITGLRLIPRASGVTGIAHNDNNVGLIRAAGSGARVQNLTFAGLGAASEANLAFLDNNTGWNLAQSRSGLVVGRVVSGTVTIQNVQLIGHTVMRMNRASVNDNNAIGGFVGGVETGTRLNIIDISAENLELHTQAGRTGAMGGVVGLSHGTVNISVSSHVNNHINVNIRGGAIAATAQRPLMPQTLPGPGGL